MSIEPKFNVGDTVFTIWLDKVNSFKIEQILIDISKDGLTIKYLSGSFSRNENQLGSSKEELLKSL